MELPCGTLIDLPYRTFESYLGVIRFHRIIKILTELPLLTTAGIYMHRYFDRLFLPDIQDLSRDDQSPRI